MWTHTHFLSIYSSDWWSSSSIQSSPLDVSKERERGKTKPKLAYKVTFWQKERKAIIIRPLKHTHTHIWLAFFSSLLGRVSHFFSSLQLWHWRALLCFQSIFGSCFLACLHSIEHFSFRLYTDFPQRDYRVWLFYYFANFFLSSPWSFSISLRLMHRHSLIHSLTSLVTVHLSSNLRRRERRRKILLESLVCVCTAQSQKEINFPLPSTAVKAAALFSEDANFFSLSLSSLAQAFLPLFY